KTLTCLLIKNQIVVFYLNIQCRKKFAIILNVTNDKLKIFSIDIICLLDLRCHIVIK
ncbi:hypothetical protein C2G38_2097860, partial [Gigaspora rosea]